MPQAVNTSIENNFVEGLKTEFTGLNFPENACTAASNCVFTLIGDVFRRDGMDYEGNFTTNSVNRSNSAISSYIWTNVGGDGQTKVYVLQIGGTLYFYQLTNATSTSPLSTTLLPSTVNISQFSVTVGANISGTECQFADGNGFLFVFHPSCDPFYCTFSLGIITANIINIQIRDVYGIVEPNVPYNFRPGSLTNDHNYNLQNQGWKQGAAWSVTPGPNTTAVLTPAYNATYTVANGLTINPGDSCTGSGTFNNGFFPPINFSGTVVNYAGTSLTVTINQWSPAAYENTGPGASIVTISSVNTGYISTWTSQVGGYPSNADVWWYYKNSTNIFNPGSLGIGGLATVTLANAPAPKGSFILSAFNLNRSTVSGITAIPTLSSMSRPRTGCWFQGRVFYAGVDASATALTEFPYYTWTENIYFSQIVEGSDTTQFGRCYQVNDPTSQNLFAILPTDGGVITIQGSGAIYKLFPVQNGLLVFAANGIWFITGSQGIGFTATDYTITKISGVQSISSTSYINVLGYPIFWNEEGIYGVAPSQTGALQVNNLCLGTILTYYQNIPLQSKKFVRGDYDPITFIAKWVYRSTNESSVTDRYQFDTVLNFNVIHKSFYPYTVTPASTEPHIHDVKYVVGPGGSGSPLPVMKYVTSAFNPGTGSYNFTFSEERDSTYVDWKSFDGVGVQFTSTFTTGYKLHGQALRKFQPLYVYVYSRNDNPTAYTINAVWDFANSPLSNRFSVKQQITNYLKSNFGMVYRRHKLRGRGMSLQLQFTSIPNQGFEIMGWSIFEHITTSP